MIDISDISLQFGGKYLFQNVSFRINSGDKAALVGANGSGKSSLFKILSSQLQPEKGTISKQKRTTIGYLPQDHVIHSGKTLIEEASSALSDITSLQIKELELTEALSAKNILPDEQQDLINNLGEVYQRLEELDSYSSSSNVEKILVGLGFEETDFNRLTDEFSGGWQMRIALAKILISQNDMLLLDEPTNHLDIDSLEWLITFLKSYKGAMIIVSHDKHFIMQTTSKTYEIFNNTFSIFSGNYNAYLKYKDERDEQLNHKYELQQKKIKETKRFIERFRYKNTKAKQVQSRIKQLEKLETIELPQNESDIKISFPEPPKSGKVNIELISINKSYGNNQIFSGVDLVINRGEKIAFVGPNGAGKTTLAKIIADNLDYNSGERILGHNTIISYYAQDVADNLQPDIDIIETVDGIAENKTIGELRSILGAFLFKGDDVFKKVGVLSGGEKSRVALAKILLTKSNFIVLDEPTNHLDISSKKVLQKALINFSGSLILVSHDVDFLQPIVSKVVEIRKGEIQTFSGGIDYYMFKRKELNINDAEQKITIGNKSVTSKKEQKRIEAEKRQAKYNATKDLISEIALLEKKIEDLEEKEKKIEITLAKPETYNDPKKTFSSNEEFKIIKEELSGVTTKWEELSEALVNIESQFE
ncbi:MAG: ABC-F family ATP-binding cassette domain-containing protein [Bacteroidetes bacterium]|nr:ABC-F family ATP-binding cassette domain-containing protein [Bacteroidota bacterium]